MNWYNQDTPETILVSQPLLNREWVWLSSDALVRVDAAIVMGGTGYVDDGHWYASNRLDGVQRST